MKKTLILPILLISLMILGACSSNMMKHTGVSQIQVVSPWVKAVPKKMRMSAGFMTLQNLSDKEDILVSASTKISEVTEIHEMVMKDGMMKMRKIPGGLKIPAKGTVVLKPGGYHLMFIRLTQDLKIGDEVKITLNFKHSGTKEITATVKGMKKMAKPGTGGCPNCKH